jgi:hypothetical protein
VTKKLSKAQIKRNRKAWVEALRSGKFKQTRGKLRSRNAAYCCLGVACEVAEVPRVWASGEYHYGPAEVLKNVGSEEWQNNASYEDLTSYSATGLPPAAQEWLGVSHEGPRLAHPVEVRDKWGHTYQEDSLIELNDTYRWSFEQIADAVEKVGLRD